jgi:hypothetical protein
MRGRILWSFLTKSIIVDLRHVDDIILEPEDTCTRGWYGSLSIELLISQAYICGIFADLWHVGSEMQNRNCSSLFRCACRKEKKDC